MTHALIPAPAPGTSRWVERFAVVGARVFDGDGLTPPRTVVVSDGLVDAVSDRAPSGVDRVDGHGAVLLPGLIDAHVHTSAEAQRLALAFGVTTTLEMGGLADRAQRRSWARDDRAADVRGAGPPVTAPAGHPTRMLHCPRPDTHRSRVEDVPRVGTPPAVIAQVERLVRSGADHITLVLEDGAVFGGPGQPQLPVAAYTAGVAAAHAADRIAITHTRTRAGTVLAACAGSDGIAHLFVDGPHTGELVETVAAAGCFVIPCLSLVSSLIGRVPLGLLADPRVTARLPRAWNDALYRGMGTAPGINWSQVAATVRAMADAGVDLLAGSDFRSGPTPGLAPGASLHGELGLLVEAGLTPVEALRAATTTPARRFGLHDRGRIAPGLRADLLLVDGDPTTSIRDTLAIHRVWRGGRLLCTG